LANLVKDRILFKQLDYTFSEESATSPVSQALERFLGYLPQPDHPIESLIPKRKILFELYKPAVVYSIKFTYKLTEHSLSDYAIQVPTLAASSMSDSDLELARQGEQFIIVIYGDPRGVIFKQHLSQPRDIPTSVPCQKDLARLTRRVQSEHADARIVADDFCHSSVKVEKNALWVPGNGPNHGLMTYNWVAKNVFQQHAHTKATVSVDDQFPPTFNMSVSRTLCVIETGRFSVPPRQCPAKLVNYHITTSISTDTCDDFDEQKVWFVSREQVSCLLVRQNSRITDYQCQPLLEDNFDNLPSIRRDPSKLFSHYQEECGPIKMGNNLKYTVIVSDSDNHFNPAQLEFIVVYVGSSQVCPVGSFMIENDKEHVLPDDELQKIAAGKKTAKSHQY
jgi:hypothetical protein